MKSQLLRFGSIGILNTAVDFIIFGILTGPFKFHFVLANIISTGIALILSFFLNGRVTFRSKLTKRNAVLFIVLTLIGLWLLQPGIIAITQPLLTPLNGFVHLMSVNLLVAKIIATLGSLVWNFIMYRYIVFPESRTPSQP